MAVGNREVHIELLIGQHVYDSTGKKAGRIEELRAEKRGDEWIIAEYLIGPAAMVERFAAWPVLIGFLRIFRRKDNEPGYDVPWHKMDLSDPENPKLTCTCADLAPFKRGS